MKMPSLRYWRTVLPATLLAATVILVARHTYPLPADSALLLWYTRLDPLLLLQHLRWEGIPAWGWLPLVTVILTLFAGRVFCGWLCPVGGLLTLLHSLKARLGRGLNGPPAWTGRLFAWRYPWLVFLLVLLAMGSGWTMYLSPFHLLTSELTRLWQQQMPWMLLALVSAGLVVFPRFWCVFICPTGLLLSLVARWRRLSVSAPAGCLQCGLCERRCPTGAAHPQPQQTGSDCMVCGRCSEVCPADSFALTAKPGDVLPPPAGGTFTRREILRAGVAFAVAGAAMPALTRPASANPLRPPGALEEDEFLARCSRCGRCIKSCPAKCIKAMPLSSGPALFLTPYIVAREARCELTQDCQKVCPTGAIAHLPVEKTLMGLAEIDKTRCIGWAEGRLCLLCQEQCPQHAIDSDAQDRPSVITDLCVGCGACENGCPLDEAAIVVRPQARRRRP